MLHDTQIVSKQDPVLFPVAKDPLGASLLGLYDGEKSTQTQTSKTATTLSSIVMSLESNTAKQQALTHILNAMHVQQLRQIVVKSLSSHITIINTSKVKKNFLKFQLQITILNTIP